ncbi:exo-alpha-sialidase [Sphingobacterium phlebotomi]|uniref:exo-alpha-sialidase n=1 Tax=Sphingobacterium phlebotomi TaxID=2605433 RepID=A0A5D4H9P7_9SPHI|nr:sialidase family protein [Sphingobacterium phlebotomi]TYR37324.1 exo-alpha-sialidase [Sphingobacterium phlebotomi]
MKTNKMKTCIFFIGIISFLISGCYREEHFDFPGPFPEEQRIPDPLPFPFDVNKQAGEWLIKDGVPDDSKVLIKGYTDYVAKGDTISWARNVGALEEFPHYNFYPLSNADHFNGDNTAYQKNRIFSKYFVPMGPGKTFYMYTKITLGTLNATAAGIPLGLHTETGNELIWGLDGGNAGQPTFFVNYYGTVVNVNPNDGWPTINEVMSPGVPAELEVVIAEGIFYLRVNNTLVFQFNLLPGQLYYYTPQIRPHRNFVKVHDLYIESNDMYILNYAMHEYEQGYTKIQSPALAKANNGDLLLFAEGRTDPISARERVAQNFQPVGNTDIIMKRSSDGGTSWSDQLVVLAGDNNGSTYCFPQVVSLGNGKIILHYTKIEGSFDVTDTYTYNGNTQQIFQIESTDNGQTWSSPVEISTPLKVANTYVRNGSGHGIELKSTTYNNRIIMPLSYSNNTVRVAISDDGGQTWNLSNQLNGSTYKYPSVVELADGRLMIVMGHTATTPRNRRRSYSSDGGQTWSTVNNISSTFVNVGQFGHLYPGVAVKGKDGEILVVTPTDRETDTQTKNTVPYPTSPVAYKSTDDGDSYASIGELHTKTTYFGYKLPYGFMDAVVLDDGTVVIVGEGGIESPTEGIVIYKK